jgi:hypothetical protein
VPGIFSVSIAKRIDGVITPLADPQTFQVESLGLASLEEKDRTALLDFQKKAGELQRAMMGAGAAAQEAVRQLQFVKKAFLDTPEAAPELSALVRKLEKRLLDLQMKLYGDRTKRSRSEPALPSLINRVSAQLGSTSPITETNKRNYEIAADAFVKVLEEMRQVIEVEMKTLQDQMEAAGAPWTPGRSLPKWKKK